jgi:hypothetical protein
MIEKLLILLIFIQHFSTAQEIEIQKNSGISSIKDNVLRLKKAAEEASKVLAKYPRKAENCAELINRTRLNKVKSDESSEVNELIDKYLLEMEEKTMFKNIDLIINHQG